eukprot:INCI7237.4.p1 GENE.INCI7237.4~~INCI7237.4.p1  ORF type:complete len:1560 (-),score=263.66 INCI7237.4:601-5280(-)
MAFLAEPKADIPVVGREALPTGSFARASPEHFGSRERRSSSGIHSGATSSRASTTRSIGADSVENGSARDNSRRLTRGRSSLAGEYLKGIYDIKTSRHSSTSTPASGNGRFERSCSIGCVCQTMGTDDKLVITLWVLAYIIVLGSILQLYFRGFVCIPIEQVLGAANASSMSLVAEIALAYGVSFVCIGALYEPAIGFDSDATCTKMCADAKNFSGSHAISDCECWDTDTGVIVGSVVVLVVMGTLLVVYFVGKRDGLWKKAFCSSATCCHTQPCDSVQSQTIVTSARHAKWYSLLTFLAVATIAVTGAVLSIEKSCIFASVFVIAALYVVDAIPLSLGTAAAFSSALLTLVVNILGLSRVRIFTPTSVFGEAVEGSIFLMFFVLVCWAPVYTTKLQQRGSKELTHTLTESIARFEAEQKFIGDLLDNILPKSIASEIKQSSIASETMATKFERVTLMFALLCGVDGASENQEDVYTFTFNFFKIIDDLCDEYNVEKIKTIGTDYMAGAGFPEESPTHTRDLCLMALAFRQKVREYSASTGVPLTCRIGLATGSAVAGVIGSSKVTYDVFGDTVNTASRMMSSCNDGEIMVTERVKTNLMDQSTVLLRDGDGKELPDDSESLDLSNRRPTIYEFAIQAHPKGEIPIKGKGMMRTFFVDEGHPFGSEPKNTSVVSNNNGAVAALRLQDLTVMTSSPSKVGIHQKLDRMMSAYDIRFHDSEAVSDSWHSSDRSDPSDIAVSQSLLRRSLANFAASNQALVGQRPSLRVNVLRDRNERAESKTSNASSTVAPTYIPDSSQTLATLAMSRRSSEVEMSAAAAAAAATQARRMSSLQQSADAHKAVAVSVAQHQLKSVTGVPPPQLRYKSSASHHLVSAQDVFKGKNADARRRKKLFYSPCAGFCNAKCVSARTARSPQALASKKLEQAFMVLMYHSTSHMQQMAWMIFLAILVVDHSIVRSPQLALNNQLTATVTMDLGTVQYIIFVAQAMAACVVSICLNNAVKDHSHDNHNDDDMVEDIMDVKSSANASVVHSVNGVETDVGTGSINESGAHSNTEHRHVMMVQLQNTTDEERDADYQRISIQSVVLWFALLIINVGLCASQLLVDIGTSRMNIYSVGILLLVTRFSPLLFVEKIIYVALQCVAFFGVQIYYGLSVSQVATEELPVAEMFIDYNDTLVDIVEDFLLVHIALVIVLFVSDYRCEHHNRREFLRLSAAEQKYAEVQETSSFSEQLLKRMPLPEQIIDQIRVTNQVKSTFIDGYGTVLFADIVSFTTFSQTLTAPQLVIMLNAMFMKFDRLAEKNEVVKIKTIGDCYVCASGVLSPMLGKVNHAEAMIMMAIDMHRAMQQINEEFGHGLRLRIGMHSGSVLGGIMGTKKLNFDLWGETVEMANRMEEDGVPERIHVSEPVYLRANKRFEFEDRYAPGEKPVKKPDHPMTQAYAPKALTEVASINHGMSKQDAGWNHGGTKNFIEKGVKLPPTPISSGAAGGGKKGAGTMVTGATDGHHKDASEKGSVRPFRRNFSSPFGPTASQNGFLPHICLLLRTAGIPSWDVLARILADNA